MAEVSDSLRVMHPLFESLEIDFEPGSRSLGRGGRCRHLAPRESRVLEILTHAPPGQVVSRAELLDGVWGEQDICEEALTVTVSRLRRHFILLGLDPHVIETVPRQGYRFLPINAARSVQFESRSGMSGVRNLAMAAVIIATLALAIAVMALVPQWM